MLYLALLGTAAFAFINGFGAWVTQNRRRWIAWLFLTACWLLVVARVMLVYRVNVALLPLAAGLLLTVLGSYVHARYVTARVTVQNHVFRLLSVLVVLGLAWAALQPFG